MRLVLAILSIIIVSFQAIGQKLDDFDSAIRLASEPHALQIEDQIAGNPYLNRQFISGTIIKTDNSEIKNIPLRYNIFCNKMQFKRNGTILDIAEPYNIKRIILDDEVFIYAPYNAAKKIRFSYFQVLNEGKFQLLKMHNVVYKGSAGSPDINNTRRFETLLPSYYLCYGNGTANLIDSKKKLIKILEPIPQEIIDYIRKNNTTINNENELIDIVRHTNRVIN